MKREILFRGKDVNAGNWVCGFLFYSRFDTASKYGFKHVIQVINEENLTYDCVEVLPETIGQLLHRDKKTDETIFEGDIIKREYNYESRDDYGITGDIKGHRIGVARWDNKIGASLTGGFWVDELNQTIEMLPKSKRAIVFSRTTVIGNIIDNPQLLVPSNDKFLEIKR